MMKNDFLDYLDFMIEHYILVDKEICKLRWDMGKPKFERDLYRETSNEVTARRQELQRTKKVYLQTFKNLNKGNPCLCGMRHKAYSLMINRTQITECSVCGGWYGMKVKVEVALSENNNI